MDNLDHSFLWVRPSREAISNEGFPGAGPGRGMGGSCPPLSKWSMTSCAYNCQPLLCFSLASTHTSRMKCKPRGGFKGGGLWGLKPPLS